VPAADVNAPPLIEYSPPVIDTAAGALIPETTISFEVTTADSAVPDWAANVKLFGVVSAAGGGGGGGGGGDDDDDDDDDGGHHGGNGGNGGNGNGHHGNGKKK